MQPAKITIKGDFIDCQIYRGRLYLWTMRGTLCTYDWNAFIDSICHSDRKKLSFTLTFKDGHYLYKNSLIELFKDPDFKRLLLRKFKVMDNLQLVFTEKQLQKFLIGEQDVPGGELPTDTEIYSSNLYFVNDNGLFCSTAHRKEGNPVSSRPVKLWDCKILSLKANRYPQIALSAGEEGLFELNVSKEAVRNEKDKLITKISKRHSSFANYSYLSIYSTSLIEKSYMAYYGWYYDNNKRYIRTYQEDIDQSHIFNDRQGISWGADDKLYLFDDNGFDIVKFSNSREDFDNKRAFNNINNYDTQTDRFNQDKNGRIINAGTAYFGNIVEFENSLWIFQSDGNTTKIEKPVTRWRIYPRSINYENQLHVILDDCIEIYSFNHDYFLDQEKKVMGLMYSPDDKIRTRNISYMELF